MSDLDIGVAFFYTGRDPRGILQTDGNMTIATRKRLAIVTGGTRGIGRAIAMRLAGSGHVVIVTGRSDGTAVVDAIHKQGGEAEFMRLDITQETEVHSCFQEVAKKYDGGCDILVNNAGIAKDFLFMRSKREDWQPLIETNLMGTLLCSRAAIVQMVKKRWGRIVNLSSVIGIYGNSGQTLYAMTKAGVIGFTKSLAKEVGSRNITVNAVAPGFIETDMTAQLAPEIKESYAKATPLGRSGTPEDISGMVDFLVSDAAAYITGQVISIDGGRF